MIYLTDEWDRVMSGTETTKKCYTIKKNEIHLRGIH